MSDVIYFCIWKTFLANLENNGFWNVENKKLSDSCMLCIQLIVRDQGGERLKMAAV
jgi:hypothetical protein